MKHNELETPVLDWLICPICKNKKRLKICKDTVITKLPLYCPKCKQETLISVKQLKLIIHQEPDA